MNSSRCTRRTSLVSAVSTASVLGGCSTLYSSGRRTVRPSLRVVNAAADLREVSVLVDNETTDERIHDGLTVRAPPGEDIDLQIRVSLAEPDGEATVSIDIQGTGVLEAERETITQTLKADQDATFTVEITPAETIAFEVSE